MRGRGPEGGGGSWSGIDRTAERSADDENLVDDEKFSVFFDPSPEGGGIDVVPNTSEAAQALLDEHANTPLERKEPLPAITQQPLKVETLTSVLKPEHTHNLPPHLRIQYIEAKRRYLDAVDVYKATRTGSKVEADNAEASTEATFKEYVRTRNELLKRAIKEAKRLPIAKRAERLASLHESLVEHAKSELGGQQSFPFLTRGFDEQKGVLKQLVRLAADAAEKAKREPKLAPPVEPAAPVIPRLTHTPEAPLPTPEVAAPAQEEPQLDASLGRILTEDPLENLLIDEAVADRFLMARTRYFAAYHEHARTSVEGSQSRDFKEAREAYKKALHDVADAALGHYDPFSLVAEMNRKEITALEIEELGRLNKIWEAARPPRAQETVEKIKKSPKARHILLGLAAGAALGHAGSSLDEQPLPINEAPRERVASAPPVETLKVVIEPVAAKKEGANQMFLDLLKQLNESDKEAYKRLAGDEKPIEAAERIAKETGFWNIGEGVNLSAVIRRGDVLSVDEGGDFVFTRKNVPHKLTDGGTPVKQNWLTYPKL